MAESAYKAAVSNDQRIQAIKKKIEDGRGTYSDADELAARTGRHTGKIVTTQLNAEAANGKITEAGAATILQQPMRENYEYVSNLTAEVQESINNKAGIGLKAVRPEINQDRIDGLSKEIAAAEDVAAISDKLISQIENASVSIVDDFVHENADFQYRSGRSPKIIRSGGYGCCAWCADLIGVYNYEDHRGTGDDIYRRHANCNCTVEFSPGDGSRENVHTKKIISREEVENRKKITNQVSGAQNPDALRNINLSPKKQLLSSRITNLRNEYIARSVGAMAENYDILDLGTGTYYHLEEGTFLSDKQVFAGKGVKKEYRDAEKFAERYGGRVEDWQHVKGIGYIVTGDGTYKAEIHWSQCEGIGKKELFIKKWLE